MSDGPSQSVACNLGSTGKLIKQALTTRSAPPEFREALWRTLLDRQAPKGAYPTYPPLRVK